MPLPTYPARHLGLLAALWLAATAAWTAPALPADVTAALARAGVPRDALVALVEELSPLRRAAPRLAWQPQRPVNPASLMKLLTTQAALDLLGPAWTWSTPVWLDGSVGADGVLDGNLVIRGSGDPTLVLEKVWLLLQRVRQQGVREIRGDIVLDRSAFAAAGADPADPGDFDDEPLRPYNVRPDALLLNYKSIALTFTPDAAQQRALVTVEPALTGVDVDATVALGDGACGDWRAALRLDASQPLRLRFAAAGSQFALACGEKTWRIAPPDPASYNARLLTALWSAMGGSLRGVVRDGAAPAGPPRFALASRALAEVVRDINKFSNNVMAQQLFLTLGLTQRGEGSTEAARAVLRSWLAERFGDAGRAALVDNGSGLSRDNRVSAQLLAELLRAAWAGPAMPELLASLPLAGVDGTLRRSTVATGRAHLKTGTLRDVAGVAGVVLADSGRRYALVAIINHPNANAARAAFDALLQWTAADVPTLISKATKPPE